MESLELAQSLPSVPWKLGEEMHKVRGKFNAPKVPLKEELLLSWCSLLKEQTCLLNSSLPLGHNNELMLAGRFDRHPSAFYDISRFPTDQYKVAFQRLDFKVWQNRATQRLLNDHHLFRLLRVWEGLCKKTLYCAYYSINDVAKKHCMRRFVQQNEASESTRRLAVQINLPYYTMIRLTTTPRNTLSNRQLLRQAVESVRRFVQQD